jgi:sugar/nucleoside kinase (ribokinase family)
MSISNIQIPLQEDKEKFEILGIGTPILDSLISVNDDFLCSLSKIHGSSSLIDFHTLKTITDKLSSPQKLVTGGCAANTIKGLTRLGHSCGFLGKIGDDQPGITFSENMTSYGVTPLLQKSELPTGQVACFITPDHERTMLTYLGAGSEMDQKDLKKELFKGVKLLHIEGYLLNRDSVVETAMKFAKEAGAIISFDLSSYEIVEKYKKHISELLSTFVNIVFANEEEAHALTGLMPEKACSMLKDLCQIAIVKEGYKGCRGASQTETAFYPAFPVKVLDTTGAGDLFASGFLHYYLQDKSLEECLSKGAHLASEVIQVFGAEIPEERWVEITTIRN